MDEESRAEFYQSGKKLDISLKKGGIFFYTTEKVKDDETFDIRTATMIVGIRGTSGYVHVDEETGVTTFYLTSGKVHIIGRNPVTGGTREADITAGQKVTTYLYNDKQGEDSIEFFIERFTQEELPTYFIERIVKVPSVLKEVVEQSGLSEDGLRAAAQSGDTGTGQDAGAGTDTDKEAGDDDTTSLLDSLIETDRETGTPDDQGIHLPGIESTSQGKGSSRPGLGVTLPGKNKNGSASRGGDNGNDGSSGGNGDNTGGGSSNSGGNTGGGDSGDSGSNGDGSDTEDAQTYTVKVSKATGGTVKASATKAKKGDTVTLTTTPKTGYELSTVSVKAAGGSAVKVTKKSSKKSTFTMPAANVTVKATFQKTAAESTDSEETEPEDTTAEETYTVTVSGTTGGTVTAGAASAKAGDTVTLTIAPSDGYELDTLSVADAGGSAVAVTQNADGSTATFTMPSGNVTVSAAFKQTAATEETYTVTVTEATGGTVTAGAVSAKAGDTVTLTIAPSDGYELDTLSVADAGGSAVTVTQNADGSTATFTMPSGNVTVSAAFKQTAATEETYTVTVTEATGGTVTAGAASAKAGDTVTLTIAPSDGYELDTLSVADEDGSAVSVTESSDESSATFTMPAKNVTVTAIFKKSYGVTIPTIANADVRLSVNGASSDGTGIYAGDEVTIGVKPSAGYELDSSTLKVNVDLGGGVTLSSPVTDSDDYVNTTFTMPSGDVTLAMPTLTKISYQITISAAANASVTAGVEGRGTVTTAQVGDQVKLTITPDTGYELSALDVKDSAGAAVSVTDNAFTMPAGNVTVSVTIVKSTYAVTISASNGTVTAKVGDAQSTAASYGDQVKLTITPDAGYETESVSVVDAGGTQIGVTDNTFAMPAAGVTVTVTFKKIDYSVTLPVDVIGIQQMTASVGGVESTTAQVGDTVTLLAVMDPEFSYQIKTLTVTQDGGGAVSVTKNSATSYSFTMPADDVTVEAGVVLVNATLLSFDNGAVLYARLTDASPTTPAHIRIAYSTTTVAELYFDSTTGSYVDTQTGLFGKTTDSIAASIESGEDGIPVAVRESESSETEVSTFTLNAEDGCYYASIGSAVTTPEGTTIQLAIRYNWETYSLTTIQP